MKHSKKIFWSLLLALPILMMASGCSKFLDRKPLTATLEDLNQGGLEGQIFGLYSNLRNSAGFTSIPWLAINDFRSDDSEKGSDPSDGAEWTAPFDRFAYVKDIWASNTYWDDHYALINLANTAIQTADSLQLTDPSSVINVAEASFIRAYSYFEMVRTYGEVPKIDFRIYNASQANIAKSPVSEIYKLIDDDLTFAAQNLPTNWISGVDNKYPGRLTSGAAKTLQAKAYLFRASWGQTLGLCQQVIASQQYSLFPSYNGIFKDAGENCSESIFEIQAYVSPNGAIDNGTSFATTQGVRASTASGWNLGWGWNTPTDSLAGAYEAGDVRRASTILFSGKSDDPATGGYGRVLPNSTFDVPAGVLPRKYWNKKIYADPAYRASTGHSDNPNWINKRILRYADIILMAAEASNETGNGAQAATYLNQVRARVSMPAVAFVNQLQMRNAIKHERRVEFGMEGERFFDLVRWGDAVDVLGSLGYTNRCRYYPIPQPSIDKSGGKLIQNPEW